jgi:hypothetical protein
MTWIVFLVRSTHQKAETPAEPGFAAILLRLLRSKGIKSGAHGTTREDEDHTRLLPFKSRLPWFGQDLAARSQWFSVL